jgi:hypothetical protein
MPVIRLKESENVRNTVTKQQEQQIRNVYERASEEIGGIAGSIKNRTDISSKITHAQLKELNAQITSVIENISGSLETVTKNGMDLVSQAAVRDNAAYWAEFGFNTGGAINRVPAEVVSKIATGQIYENGRNLSHRIWGVNNKTLQDIYSVIAKDTAMNKSVYDIAKDIEMYVNPKAVKNWEWSKVYTGTSRRVDYNAQRLARTLTQHAFQQATIDMNNPNPFVIGYEWHSALIHGRTCKICTQRHGTVYPKDSVPLDHPNGLCTIMPYIEDDLSAVANKIADWAESPDETFPEIDRYMKFLQEG